MAPDSPDDVTPLATPPGRPDARTERELREAEDLALLASGLGSGLLRRQPLPESDDTVAVLKVCPHCGTDYETAARFCPADGTALRPKGSDSLIDRVIAERYHILKRIGEGGMGRVYLGEHVKMNRQCAIKVMNPALVNDHESATRFAREASSAARIIHPNVAAVFDFGDSDGLVYLVMEFVDGEPLSRIMAREAPLSVERAVDITRQIADGLGAAHELGIVHRDLKPDNILIARTRGGKEVAKVVDFGIAKAMQEAAGEALTRTGLVIGTPEFMSPEQLLGDPIDARSDLYAVGCILHLMLTAIPPFEAPTRELMIKRRLAEDAPHVQALNPALPDSLDRIVLRLLARTPGDRYGSAAEVRDALAGIHARVSGPVAQVSSRAMPTPRSAPTIAFQSLANATTEVTPAHGQAAAAPVSVHGDVTDAVASPGSSRRRLRLAAGGAVALGAVLLLARLYSAPDAAAVPPVPPARDSTRVPAAIVPPVAARAESLVRAPAATAGRDSALPATRTPPAPPASPAATARPSGGGGATTTTGSAASASAVAQAQEQERARRRSRDSAARVQGAVPGVVRRAIQQYARAIESRDPVQLRAAYPRMSSGQEESWRRLFDANESIDVSITYRNPAIMPTSIDAPFTLALRFVNRESKQRSTSRTPLHALFMKDGNDWVLREIR